MKVAGKIEDRYYPEQWNLQLMRVPEAWALTMGRGVQVGLIDSGVDGSHLDLGWNEKLNISALDSDAVVRSKYRPVMEAIAAGSHPKILPGWNFIDGSDFTWDRYRHGTYMAGTIAAEADGLGMVGVAPYCKIRPYVVLNPDGSWAGEEPIAKGVLRAFEDGCDVISMSLAWYRQTPLVADAVEKAVNGGCIVVAATGNRNRQGIAYPAAYPDVDVIAVGGCNPKGQRWTHNRFRGSSYGEAIDCVAPAAPQITAHRMRSRYSRVDGTSMACANMAGVIALLRCLKPDLSAMETQLLIRNHCSYKQWAIERGYGVPNAFGMAQSISGYSKSTTVDSVHAALSEITVQLAHQVETLGKLI